MVDHLTQKQRSAAMSKVRGKNTTPEMKVRRMVHSIGYRYRLHRKDLPGKPDLVFPRLGKLIFVHGCFWHMHRCKRLPKSNLEYWKPKFEENARRDKRIRLKLKKRGWEVLTIWECQTKKLERMLAIIVKFLSQ